MDLHSIALCAGVGMLDEGLRAACEFLGIRQRTVCYVEREASAASTLVGRMEEKCLDEAPVWSDLTTFNGRAWHRRVDCITAGFPCQPHSVAGARKGVNDERWLWVDIYRIIRDISPRFVFLENVRGLLSSGGFTEVIRSLVALGFSVEWGVLAASEVGASHQRERIFILAYRDSLRELQQKGIKRQFGGRVGDGSGEMADADGVGRRIESDREQQPVWPYRGITEIFAPGPDSPDWKWRLKESPWITPAIESGVRMLADGVAVVVDESRSDQLRGAGNGVVPLQAATAFVLLARRAGIV